MQPLTKMQIQTLYEQAMNLREAGKAEEALGQFGQIIEANPNIAEPHFQAARIFLDGGRYDRAITHFLAAATLKAAEPVIWQGWAAAVALLGAPEAERTFLAALKKSPLAPEVRLVLQDRFGALRATSRPALGGVAPKDLSALVANARSGNHSLVETQARALLALHPQSAAVSNILGLSLAGQSRPAEAAAAFAAAVRMDRNFAEGFMNLGQSLMEQGKPQEAMRALREAVICAPDLVPALTNLGRLMADDGAADKALVFLQRAQRLAPDSIPMLVALAAAYNANRQNDLAEVAYQRAADLSGHRSARILAQLGKVQSRLGKDTAALASFDAALAIDPNQPAALGGKALLMQTMGQFDAAEEWFRRAFEHDPKNGMNYRLFLASHKTRAGDPIIAQMQALLDLKGPQALGALDRVNLGFALAKALEDTKDYDKVFPYLSMANVLVHNESPYDMALRHQEIAMMQKAMAGFDWQGAHIPGTTDYAPIFVTGMPRSGTTLVEQIIASHSDVTGAGEVGEGTRLGQNLLLNPQARGFHAITELPAAAIAAMGHEYQALMRARCPDTPRVTDKSIQTYLVIGLMKLALPNARFIVVRRDPRDNLLSMYKNKFPDGTHLYAYDQRELATYYTTFVSMIDFWRREVPEWFYEVQYEDLVADPEVQTRRLIAACGLEWQDSCLNFHQNNRKVDTLSLYQVRQPMSSGSVKSWQRYEADLAPMLQKLAEDGHISL